MNHKTPSFVSPWLVFLAFASVYTGFHFYNRVLFLPDFYFWQKVGFAAVFAYLAYAIRTWTLDDVKTSLLIVVLNVYCIVNIWFAPMHLLAFTFFVIFSCFLPFRRRWLFFTIQAISCLSMTASYIIQHHIGWKISRMGYADAASMILVTFLFAWTLRKYVIDVNNEVNEHLHRTSLIGVESTRLLHDLKGLLSSPIMILDGLKSREHELSREALEKHLIGLTEDLHNVRAMIQSIHRLVSDDVVIVEHGILSCIESARHVLERRLTHVKIAITESDRVYRVTPDRLHSIFFNLFLNSIEAFERKNIVDPMIEIFWHGDDLIYRDNAGGFPKEAHMTSSKGSGSGLGLNLVKHDLHRMGAKMKVTGETNSTSFALRFLKV